MTCDAMVPDLTKDGESAENHPHGAAAGADHGH